LSTAELYFPINGTIKEVNVTVGIKLKAGDIIARLDAEKYELDLQSARANYQAAHAKLANAIESYNDKLIAAKEKMDQAIINYKPMSQIPDVFSRQELASIKSAAGSEL
jgi:multidrug resistance efflux pump